MRLMVFALIFVLFIGMLSIPVIAKSSNSGNGSDDNESDDLNDDRGQYGILNQTQQQIKNQTKDEDKNKTKDQEQLINQTQLQNQTEEQEIEEENNGKGNGISKQVHQIIEARKNGSITVPQGMFVRIIAHNHSLSVDNATEILNETLEANLVIEGKQKRFRLELGNGSTNITDDNVTVTTNETLELENDSLFVGGKKILIMPSELPGKIKTNSIKSAVLHVPFGDPLYSVNATRKAKVLWLFDADMDVELDLDAVNGTITDEKRPWWSFLAGVQDEE